MISRLHFETASSSCKIVIEFEDHVAIDLLPGTCTLQVAEEDGFCANMVEQRIKAVRSALHEHCVALHCIDFDPSCVSAVPHTSRPDRVGIMYMYD